MATTDAHDQYVKDPKAWRALAHPIRMRLLDELGRLRTARAADLAESIDEPANSVSFHLRQLARYGFIQLDNSQHGDQREKWWRATTDRLQLRLDDDNDSPTNRSAFDDVLEIMRATNHQLVDDFTDAVAPDGVAAPASDDENQQVETNWDIFFDLTPQDWNQLKQELADVLDRWREHSTPAPDRNTYRLVGFGADRKHLDDARHRRDAGSRPDRAT